MRKGKANCAVTDDWGWSLLHEVRRINMLTLMCMRRMQIMVTMDDNEVNLEDVVDDGDDPPHDSDAGDAQAGAADCLGAIQLVERECRGLVNSRDHLGRWERVKPK